MRRRSILIAVAAGGCALVAAAALLLGEPAVADAQLSADGRALDQATRHQASIDGALQLFLQHNPTPGGESDDRLLAQSNESLAQYTSARNLVRGDIAALQHALQPSWLVVAAWSRAGALQTARQRTGSAIAALQQANSVLNAAVDQERLQGGFFYAAMVEAKMLTAIENQQYVQVDGWYAQANRALKVSESLMGQSDESPGYRPVIVAMRTVIDQTQKYAGALLRGDDTAASALHGSMRTGYASLAAATTDASVNANNDWNDRTFQPLVAAYHSGLAAVVS